MFGERKQSGDTSKKQSWKKLKKSNKFRSSQILIKKQMKLDLLINQWPGLYITSLPSQRWKLTGAVPSGWAVSLGHAIWYMSFQGCFSPPCVTNGFPSTPWKFNRSPPDCRAQKGKDRLPTVIFQGVASCQTWGLYVLQTKKELWMKNDMFGD